MELEGGWWPERHLQLPTWFSVPAGTSTSSFELKSFFFLSRTSHRQQNDHFLPVMAHHSILPNTRAIILPSALPTPSHGPGGTFTIACSTRLPASPTTCLSVVLNAPEYSKWNPFCRTCIIDSDPIPNPNPSDAPTGPGYLTLGTAFTFGVHMDLKDTSSPRATPLVVSVLERIKDRDERKGWRVAWKMRPTLGIPAWMLKAERVLEFVESEVEGETDYVCWETFYGVLGGVTRVVVGGKLPAAYEGWNEGLRGALGS
ncbi:hypothetical protein B0T14DRAFT_506003 [Immersiella caudata]|uniref:Coenzyme Q-binding protein COQ10 START domain-containing protein n=1 Tax=Immersiella caudata TaxID=314043 RepID=A0AA40CBY3_9PEZI|nr:hypothetical protein B0T14DRAFT_506003 [Immersiella caudata]